MTHRAEAIRNHTARVEAATRAYNLENHCHCGAFVHFAPNYRDARACDQCRATSRKAD